MKVAVLGSGDVAKTLASGFVKHGHQVMMGSRTPDKLAEWKTQNPTGSTGTFAAAAAFGELVVLAVKGGAAMDAFRLASAGNLAGKTVVDACNPIADAPPVNGVGGFKVQVQQEFAGANFVKAFNSVGAGLMVNPEFAGGKPTMFICGNSEAAKKSVVAILDQFGWETADMGTVEAARAIEPLCMLWCIPGFRSNDWTHAFKMLKK
jgi:hypothetical protein